MELLPLIGAFLQWALVILQVAVGLGLVILIHELGHFLAAKWAGVKVERFSIGFPIPNAGPTAILVCALVAVLTGLLRLQEASLPALAVRLLIGGAVGAVAMVVGRWGSIRLYTDKSGTEYVLGFLPLGGYVKMLGQDDADARSMTDEEIRRDPRSYPAQPVLKRMVIISAGVVMNVILAFVVFVLAFRIGVSYAPCVIQHVAAASPAWRAGLRPGDEIIEVNGRTNPKFEDLRTAAALTHPGSPIHLIVRRGDSPPFAVDLVPQRGEGDLIPSIGVEASLSTQLGTKNYTVKWLPAARAQPAFQAGDTVVAVDGAPIASFVELQTALARRAREDVIMTVERRGADQKVQRLDVHVGPTRARSLGLHMRMGPILAVQSGSPAEKAGLREGDVITHLETQELDKTLDPLRFPDALYRAAGQPVRLRLASSKSIEVVPEPSPGWLEGPHAPDQPLAAPALGIVYEVVPEVAYVEPGSPAAAAGIREGDRLTSILLPAKKEEPVESVRFELDKPEYRHSWGLVAGFILPQDENPEVELTFVGRSPVRLKAVPDEDWFIPVRGLIMQPLARTMQTRDIVEAVRWGARETSDQILQVYLQVRAMLTGTISPKAMGGIFTIATAAGEAAKRGAGTLLRMLGIISATLAVINFFPIPVLDGGHMLFLLWELVRGKPPSERVLVIANYVGLAVVLALMLGVLYLDIFVHRRLG